MTLLDFVFPKYCLGCKGLGKYLCNECLAKSGRINPICIYCKKASIHGQTHSYCRQKDCMDGLISVWDYEGIVRRAILSLKYKYATEVGKELTGYLTDWLLGNKELFIGVSSLVPIPIHWHRENVRGFNQSEEIGKSISAVMNWKYIPNLLLKKQSTISQVELGGEERSQNLKGVFEINPNHKLDTPASVLLFDDVFTTGSTLKEAAKVLKMAGIEKVWGFTIAK